MKVKVQIDPAPRIMKRLGVTKDGDIQRAFTAEVLKRIQKYMPFRTGETIKTMIAQTNINKPEIVVDVPYARFLYYGKLMVDPETGKAGIPIDDGFISRKGVEKVKSDRDITYTTTKNPKAGPYWERRMMAAEKNAILASMRAYVKKKGGK